MQAGREIKFRAWNQEKNIMVYDDEDGSADYWDGVCVSDVEMVNATLERKNRYVWMQFTGLRDKNGKEIYEGDIGEREGVLYQVLWIDQVAKFGVKVIKTNNVLSRGLSFPIQHYIRPGTLECSFKVIGNIYKNPELLLAA